jgi:hypothetical protein
MSRFRHIPSALTRLQQDLTRFLSQTHSQQQQQQQQQQICGTRDLCTMLLSFAPNFCFPDNTDFVSSFACLFFCVCTIFHSAGIRKYRVKPAVGHKIIQLTTQTKYKGKVATPHSVFTHHVMNITGEAKENHTNSRKGFKTSNH